MAQLCITKTQKKGIYIKETFVPLSNLSFIIFLFTIKCVERPPARNVTATHPHTLMVHLLILLHLLVQVPPVALSRKSLLKKLALGHSLKVYLLRPKSNINVLNVTKTSVVLVLCKHTHIPIHLKSLSNVQGKNLFFVRAF